MSSVGLSVAETSRRTVALARPAWLHWPRDRWLVATILLAVACSVGAWWYAYTHHLGLLSFSNTTAYLVT